MCNIRKNYKYKTNIEKGFTIVRISRSTFCFDMMKEYYRDNPEMFRRINDSHYSNSETEKHITVGISYNVKHHTTREIMRTNRYTVHIYFTEDSMSRGGTYRKFTRITAQTIDGTITEVARFY